MVAKNRAGISETERETGEGGKEGRQRGRETFGILIKFN